MDLEFELLTMLVTAVLFSLAGVFLNDYKSSIVLKIMASLTWFVMALSHVASDPSFVAFSVVFLGIGIILAISAVMDVLGLLQSNKVQRDLWWQS